MKRYWKLIILTVAIVLVIGGFYIQTGIAKSHPSFKIKTVEGNVEEVEGMVVDANYHFQNYATSEGIRISTNGTEYFSDRSVVDSLFGSFNHAEIKRLQEDYRSFMRGKYHSLSSFYENDEFLTYADVSSGHHGYVEAGKFAFHIDILNKSSKENVAYEIDVPNKTGLYYIGVEDVQVAGDVLKVFTMNRGNEKLEVHVYSFDIQTGKLLEDEIIVAVDVNMNGNTWRDIYIQNDYHDIWKNEYTVFKVMETKHIESDDYPYGYEEQTIDRFVSYHVETAETKEFKVEELNLTANELAPFQDTTLVSGDTAYFSTVTAKGIEIYPYSLKDDELGEPTVVQVEHQSASYPLVKMNNDRLYVTDSMSDEKMDASITVADINTGNILFKGIIEIEDNEGEPLDYSFHINDLIFQ